MAAVIYRQGIHEIDTAGVQVGQWVFTGRPNVPYYEAEFVHIEQFTHPGTNEVLNDANFEGDGAGDDSGTLPIGSRELIFSDDEGADWEVGDIIDFRGSTSGADFVLAEVESAASNTHWVREAVSGAIIAGELVVTFAGDQRSVFSNGQTITVGSNTYIVANTLYNPSGLGVGQPSTFLEITQGTLPADSAAANTIFAGNNVTGHRSLFVNVFAPEADIAEHTNQLTGDITFLNLSQLEEGEHFTFINNGHGNGPLYLTQGYIVVPAGLEITANTLS